jgi:methylphosphotriester-DNA--protein-cysteine methyltransferase
MDENGSFYMSEVPGMFGGHRKTRIYGRLDCSSANRAIANGGYVEHRVFFKNEETAIKAGYRPCGTCMRKEYAEWKNNA